MMSACASLASVSLAGARPVDRPMVLLDGVIEPRLNVLKVEMTGPLDERLALLSMTGPMPAAQQWLIVQALRLCDGQIRRRVLVHGKWPRWIDSDRIELRGAWSELLDEPLEQVPTLDREGSLVLQSGGWLAATRSDGGHDVDGRQVYVLQHEGAAWTVRQALESVSAFAGLALNLSALPRETADAPLVAPIDLSLSLRRVLEQVLEPYGLCVTRDLSYEGHSLIERRNVRSLSRGRCVRMRWARENQPLGEVLRMSKRNPRAGSRLWLAQAGGPMVESTFPMVGGWDPNLEGAADDEYDRSAGSNFSLYANVYRHWVLNEDGAYSGEPFNRGVAYDLAGLFRESAVAPTALRFLSCVTLDDAGRGRDPIVEFSTDGGLNWSRWAGRLQMLSDRAGVYLNDTTLPAAFLSAAKAGSARVRVTASLRSPLPVSVQRWQGNPFTGLLPPRRLDLSKMFTFRHVDPSSIHYDDVGNGALIADERDDGSAMTKWLIDRMWRCQQSLSSREGQATLKLLDADVVVHPGDQLLDAGAAARDLDEQAQALRREGGIVTAVAFDFSAAATTVQLRF
ncbi:MAG: hypothetical protein IT445_12785 [Phycisphaeraceae bacterium]|nr:hypothetical protein [Phycisphaeraceae bacterium]